MRNAGLKEAQAGIKIAGRNINSLRYADDTTHMAESKEELKNLFMTMKEESDTVTYLLFIFHQGTSETLFIEHLFCPGIISSNLCVLI